MAEVIMYSTIYCPYCVRARELLTSKNILKKTDNPLVSNFAAKIFNTQMKEIEEMEGIIKRI